MISLIPILAKMRAYWPKQPFGLSVKNRHDAPCSPTGLVSQGADELPHRNQKDQNRAVDLWTIRLRRTGALAVENAARFPPRTPLPTSSTAHHQFSYILKSKAYKGSGERAVRSVATPIPGRESIELQNQKAKQNPLSPAPLPQAGEGNFKDNAK
jgi:hypothetical protein